jgi:hypothetical protein
MPNGVLQEDATMADAAPKIVRLRIELSGIDPSVWRRVDVPADFPLRRLHDVIQAVFDWLDYHLHQFEIGDRLYGAPEYDEGDLDGTRLYDDRNIRLGVLVDRGVERFVYRYDFGDNWEHVVTVERVLDPQDGVEYPILVDGARRAPPEDCGGPPGFDAFLEAMRDAAHEDHKAMLEWYGERFNPEDLEMETVEAMLGRIRASRRKGPAKGSRATSNRAQTARS